MHKAILCIFLHLTENQFATKVVKASILCIFLHLTEKQSASKKVQASE